MIFLSLNLWQKKGRSLLFVFLFLPCNGLPTTFYFFFLWCKHTIAYVTFLAKEAMLFHAELLINQFLEPFNLPPWCLIRHSGPMGKAVVKVGAGGVRRCRGAQGEKAQRIKRRGKCRRAIWLPVPPKEKAVYEGEVMEHKGSGRTQKARTGPSAQKRRPHGTWQTVRICPEFKGRR
jgi:hypothetical protein